MTLDTKADLTRVAVAGFLILSWCFLTAVSIQPPFFGKFEVTFWQALGYLSADNLMQGLEIRTSPGAGIYGFLAVLTLAGPFLHRFWRDRRAYLGGFLPLGFMVLVGVIIRQHVLSLLAGQLAGPYEPLRSQVQTDISNAISFGSGTYLSVFLALYFAVIGTKQFAQARSAAQGKQYEGSRERAA